MQHEQYGMIKASSYGMIAAFGLLTMSSNFTDNLITSMNIRPDYYYESIICSNNENTVCNSSMLSEKAIGDIFLSEYKTGFVHPADKINVNLQITRISKYVSDFDFEEEYEEI